MRSRWLVGLLLAIFVVSLVTPAAAGEGDKIVRTKSLTGLPVISTVCQLLGCQVLGSLDTLPGETSQQSSLFLVRGLVEDTVNFLLSLLGLASIEPEDTGNASAGTSLVRAEGRIRSVTLVFRALD